MTDIQKRIKDLEMELDRAGGEKGECYRKPKAWCMSTLVLMGVLSPLIIFVTFYAFKPRIVQSAEKDNQGNNRRSTRKLIFWTGIVTALLWGVMFAYYWVSNGKSLVACFSS